MAKCTDDNVFAGLAAHMEESGTKLKGVDKLSKREKIAYAGMSNKLKEGQTDGKGPFKLGGNSYYQHALPAFGDDSVRPLVEKAAEVIEQAASQGLTRQEGKKLWDAEVVPIAKKLLKTAKNIKDPSIRRNYEDYLNLQIQGGRHLKAGNDNWVHDAVRTFAGNITGIKPAIAFYDFYEFAHKSNTVYNPLTTIKGLAMLFKKHGPKAFGRIDDIKNKGLYHKSPFIDENTGAFKKTVAWLNDHLDPQYYSNNFLTNASAYVGKAAKGEAGMAEAVRKVAFIPEPGNEPLYMLKGDVDVIWARYSTEAFKFFAQTNTDLITAIANRDAKAATNALGGLMMFYSIPYLAGGTEAAFPPGLSHLIDFLATDKDSDEDVFEWLDSQLPGANLTKKGTGVDVGRNLQIGLPGFGIAWSAFSRMPQQLAKYANKSKEAWEEGDIEGTTFNAFLAFQLAASAKFRGIPFTKTFRDMTIFGAEWANDEIEYPKKELVETLFGKDTAKAINE